MITFGPPPGAGPELAPTPRRVAPRCASGAYRAVAFLRPHFQLETLTTSMRLVAEIPKKS